MHFGLFIEEIRQGASQVASFRDIFELAGRAEALGIDCVWLGEIHFTPQRSVISSSLQVASSIASRTQRLRVGTAVQVLPLNHPLRIAEEVATVDQISEGRFEYGIGRSGSVRTYDVFGIPYGESQARFLEALVCWGKTVHTPLRMPLSMTTFETLSVMLVVPRPGVWKVRVCW